MTSIRKITSISLLLLLLFFSFTSAKRSTSSKRIGRPLPLISVHLVDRNGFAETITNKERLVHLQNIDFLTHQPYQKVLRIFARDSKGNIRSIVTSYHANGNPKQFLEIVNARAYGTYKEWHANGTLAVMATVIGGTPDIVSSAESTWLFDGISMAWNEEGSLLAEIMYSQGVLEGYSTYYHACGQIWKRIPYCKGKINGIEEVYREDGQILSQTSYCQGLKQGAAARYWNLDKYAAYEEYSEGRLECGQYYNQSEQLIAQIDQGNGFRAVFGKDSVIALQEYKQGLLDGEVKVFGPQGRIKKVYHIKKDLKHGEEIEYYDFPRADPTAADGFVLQPKLSLYWYEGAIQGLTRTWYTNGNQESQREWAKNTKNGVSTAWYEDGNIMLIEEYDQDKLIRGEYFRKGERTPITQVIQGKGTVTMFDAAGHFIQKIPYVNGKPDE